MVADPRQELHVLIDQLGDDDAMATLGYARRLLDLAHPSPVQRQIEPPRLPHALPTLHRSPPIGSIDELRMALFSPEENAEDFAATVRHWREEPEGV